MNDSLNRILLATDGSAGAECAARTAIRLADATGCELHLVYVERLPGGSANVPISARHIEGELQERAEREGLGRLLDLDGRLRTVGGVVAGAHLRMGEVAKEVGALAEELEADLIVVGRRGRSTIARAVMGSVSRSVVRHAPCPVVVARSQGTGESGKRGLGSGILSWGAREPRRQ
jgi:nucleotide-binding universal stress UspA family protein